MAFSVKTNSVKTECNKRPWFDIDDSELKCPPRKKVNHRAIPDSYGNHMIATKIFETKLDGQDIGIQANFACEDLYKIILTPGSHVLISPDTSGIIEIASLIAMNYKGIGGHPIFVVTTSNDKVYEIEDKLGLWGITIASDFSGTDKSPHIVEEHTVKNLKDYLADNSIIDAIVIFDFNVSKTHIEYLLDGDLKTLRTLMIMSNDHVSEIKWHKKMKFQHKAYFVSCAKMMNAERDDLTIVSEDTASHRGSKEDIESSLRWIWNSKIDSNIKKKNNNGVARTIKACRSWIHNLKKKIEDDTTCSICMEESQSRAIMDCCSASYCSECVFQWVNNEGTCPNCRAEANINTMHVIK